MIVLGIGEIIGAMIFGRVIDKFGKKAGVLFVLITTMIAFVFVFIVIGLYKFSILDYFLTFFWGIQDSALNNMLNCILGFEYESKIVPFSISKLVKSLFIFAALVSASFVKEQWQYIIFFVCTCVYSIPAIGILLFFDFKNMKKGDLLFKEKNLEK